jgi:hypothetical protein
MHTSSKYIHLPFLFFLSTKIASSPICLTTSAGSTPIVTSVLLVKDLAFYAHSNVSPVTDATKAGPVIGIWGLPTAGAVMEK